MECSVSPTEEAQFAAMREALGYALLSHSNKGKAQPCDCSQCSMIRMALKPEGGKKFADRVRSECIQLIEWREKELKKTGTFTGPVACKELADMIRSQMTNSR